MDRRSFLRAAGVTGGIASISSALPSDVLSLDRSERRSQFASLLELRNAAGGVRTALSASLDPWSPSASEPWDMHRINHLYRRAGFGASLAEIKEVAKLTPSQAVDALLGDDVIAPSAIPAPPAHSDEWMEVAPYFGSDLQKQTQQQAGYTYARLAIRRQWIEHLARPKTMLREKMLLFWLNHFVVQADEKVYFPQMVYKYIDYFRRNPWGNFKQMVKDVTISPAMLLYLDGAYSYRTKPNENYARELMELFTLGVVDKDGNPNYTETDIHEVAKALTGYFINFTATGKDVLTSYYDVNQHDSTLKSPFGAPRKNYGLKSSGIVQDDVIDLLFTTKADSLAWFICSKLYQYFVYHDISGPVERGIIDQMAQTFKNSNWELKPVLAQLFKSQHFFDDANIGAEIKSPIEFLVNLSRTFDISLSDLQAGTVYYYSVLFGQNLFDPPNVKGWPGDKNWISTTTLPLRNIMVAELVVNKQLPAQGITGYGQNNEPLALPDAALITWAKQFDNYNGALEDFIKELTVYLCTLPPSDKAIQTQLLSKLPPKLYEWSTLQDSERIPALRLIIYQIALLAEFQLA